MKKILFSIAFVCLATFLACAASKNTGIAVGAGTKEAAQQVGDKTTEAAQQVGDTVTDASATVTDASITAAVKMKMADDPSVSGMKINVDTTDGNVTLSGTVKDQAETDQAVQIAKSVDGVKSVESKLSLQ
jgi:osmotically-inducible protein OsmY